MSGINQLQRSTPEELGIHSSAVLNFIEAIEKNKLELHSFMLLRHGSVAAEGWWSPYRPELPHMLFSLSKSFTSTAIGLAVTEGRMSVDDPVLSFFPDDGPEKPGENLTSMRVRHLLSMSTGHAEDTTGRLHDGNCENWVRGFLGVPVDHTPGTHFVYNSGATYMLSAIIQKVTGQTLLDYLQPRLFAPLGIEGATWETCPMGINTGGWGLSIKTEDIAKFGQLYLQKGIWKGKRIIPLEWVEEATSPHISNGNDVNSDWQQGYGYQFWRCRHGAYRGDGAFGQFCVVMPEQDAVIAITSGLNDMQAVLNLVWEHLLPAMANESQPSGAKRHEELKSRLSALSLVPPSEQSYSPAAGRISGSRYNMEENEVGIKAVSFDFKPEGCVLTQWDSQGEHRIRCGLGEWIEGEAGLPGDRGRAVVSGTWTDENTFVVTRRLIETPFSITSVCRFEGDRICVESSINVSFGPTALPAINGKMA